MRAEILSEGSTSHDMVVAYIDGDGDLRIDNGWTDSNICIGPSGVIVGVDFDPATAEGRKFYEGDSVTIRITF